MKKILITGAGGQIGSELALQLRTMVGTDAVVVSDVRDLSKDLGGPAEVLDVLDGKRLGELVAKCRFDTIFHLAAILSATGEQNPQRCYRINADGLFNILEVSREHGVKKVIVPSSIAAFGPVTPDNPSEFTIQRPTTMYGITKVFGELLADYYFAKYGLDVRGVRYPGIISWKTEPGGGTTDYAVAVYYEALRTGRYAYFVRKDTVLPMMYMPDALKALVDLAGADGSRLRHRTYNVASMSFSAGELTDAVQHLLPDFRATYEPDQRQAIADSWPQRLDDRAAREDWNWAPAWDIHRMSQDMVENLRAKFAAPK